MNKNYTQIYILTGKSGSGKDAVLHTLREKYGMHPIISTTSRPIRINEKDGVDYNFVTKEEFEQGIIDGLYCECRSYHTTVNNVQETWYYGCPKQELQSGETYAIILDMQGTKDFVNYYGRENCFVVNIQTYDWIREQRAYNRGSFDKSEWERRLADDAIKFDEKTVSDLSDFIIQNNNCTLDALASLIVQFGSHHFETMKKC